MSLDQAASSTAIYLLLLAIAIGLIVLIVQKEVPKTAARKR